MAKGIGLIGNFKGKVGNTVGYKLTASNNGQTQGIRVYQPIVKNPKSAGQAEQRAKLLAVNATYRALKMVIDRGNEGLPYGNKSRLAWLKTALMAEGMPWIEKGMDVTAPVLTTLTKGTLPGISYTPDEDYLNIVCTGVTSGTTVGTVGTISTLLKAAYSWLQDGDQITILACGKSPDALQSEVFSLIIDPKSDTAFTKLTAGSGVLQYESGFSEPGYAVIVSREGANGEHLRSTAKLQMAVAYTKSIPYDDKSKTAAIASYRASAASNSDWAEESIQ